VCGDPFVASRDTAKFCGSTCRKRASRGAVSVGPVRPVVAVPLAAGEAGGVEAATRAELDAVGRTGSSEGQKALMLARRLDADVRDTGMGLAAVMRAHSVALAEAVKGATVADDPVDELRARRDEKRAAG
jgi:hypothetical protein